MRIKHLLILVAGLCFCVAPAHSRGTRQLIVTFEEPDAQKGPQLREEAVGRQQRFVEKSIASNGWKVASVRTEGEDGGKKDVQVAEAGKAVVVDIGDEDILAARLKLLAMPDVKRVTVPAKHDVMLFSSRELIGMENIPKQERIVVDGGAGMKIGIVDTGVYANASMFSDEGLDWPDDLKGGDGELSNCNKKVVSSRVFYNPSASLTEDENHSYQPKDGNCHGIHVASTAAGSPTNISYKNPVELEGVAPKAWIYNHRMVSFTDSEIFASMEEHINKKVDVSSNSWGKVATHYNKNIYMNQRYAAASGEPGKPFYVFSAGNSGPHKMTTTWGAANLQVAAVSKESIIYPHYATFSGETTERKFLICSGPILPQPVDLPIIATYDANSPDGCNPFTKNNTNQYILVSFGGNCDVQTRMMNIMVSNAAGVIIKSDESEVVSCGFQSIPGSMMIVMIGSEDGAELEQRISSSSSGSASVTAHINQGLIKSATPRVVADWSSRGPTVDFELAPHVAAPGDKIFAAGYGEGDDPRIGYGVASGTSMAAPHVSGAAALIKKKFLKYASVNRSVERDINVFIRSAIINKANRSAMTSSGARAWPLDVGGGILDLNAALSAELYIMPPVISFPPVERGIDGNFERRKVILKIGALSDSTYTIELDFDKHSSSSPIKLSSTSLVIDGNDKEEEITVVFDADNTTDLYDHQGYLILRDKSTNDELATVPYWIRVFENEELRKDYAIIIYNDLGKNTEMAKKFNDIIDKMGKMDNTTYSRDIFEVDKEESISGYTDILSKKYRYVIVGLGNSKLLTPKGLYPLHEAANAGVPVYLLGAQIGEYLGMTSDSKSKLGYQWYLSTGVASGAPIVVNGSLADLNNLTCNNKSYFVPQRFREFSKNYSTSPVFENVTTTKLTISDSADVSTQILLVSEEGNIMSVRKYPSAIDDVFNTKFVVASFDLEKINPSFVAEYLMLLKGMEDNNENTEVEEPIYLLTDKHATVSVTFKDETKVSAAVISWGDGESERKECIDSMVAVFEHEYKSNGTYGMGVILWTEYGSIHKTWREIIIKPDSSSDVGGAHIQSPLLAFFMALTIITFALFF